MRDLFESSITEKTGVLKCTSSTNKDVPLKDSANQFPLVPFPLSPLPLRKTKCAWRAMPQSIYLETRIHATFKHFGLARSLAPPSSLSLVLCQSNHCKNEVHFKEEILKTDHTERLQQYIDGQES